MKWRRKVREVEEGPRSGEVSEDWWFLTGKMLEQPVMDRLVGKLRDWRTLENRANGKMYKRLRNEGREY